MRDIAEKTVKLRGFTYPEKVKKDMKYFGKYDLENGVWVVQTSFFIWYYFDIKQNKGKNAMLDAFILTKNSAPPGEGELYKEINIFGERFEIFYGYYEECERDNENIEPMPIYPDFIINPKFTKDGRPFVTKMQDACKYYKGKILTYKECADCEFYRHGEDFLGICMHEKNKIDGTGEK